MAQVAKTNQVLPGLPAKPSHVQWHRSEAGLPKPGAPQEHFASRQNINTSLLKSTKQGSLCTWPQRRFWSPAGCSLACRWRRTSHWARQCDPVAQDRLTRKWLITKWPVTLAESRVRASVGSHWLGWTGLCCAMPINRWSSCVSGLRARTCPSSWECELEELN